MSRHDQYGNESRSYYWLVGICLILGVLLAYSLIYG
jgi:hypothetical protein